MDFGVDSFHSLCIGATYIGSEDLGLNLYERIDLIKAVEQSQIQQANALGNSAMGMIGIDESDTIYHSFRSTTAAGLEVASLVAGGYGAVKGGMIGLSKVIFQMENNLTTGLPYFHGFPKIVDNYASFGQRRLITGRDGLTRTKITLDGGYKGRDGHFEWIIETDSSVNHRLFIPSH